MRNISGWVILTAVMLSGCATGAQNGAVNAVFRPGETRTEPIIFNDKRYLVSLSYLGKRDVFDIGVMGGQGRPLGGTPGDQKIIESVASSTLRHFACNEGQKGQIVPGSPKHAGRVWMVKGRCV